jgi:type IV secretory pathway VirB6-like protein
MNMINTYKDNESRFYNESQFWNWTLSLKHIIMLILLIFNISESIANTPSCNKDLNKNCDNSCVALPLDFPSAILYAFDPVYQALDRKFDMTGAEANRSTSTLSGIKNVIQTSTIKGSSASYNYITDGNGNLCTGPQISSAGSSQICTQAAPDKVDGCTIKANDVKFTIAGNSYTQKPGDFVRIAFDDGISYLTVLKVEKNADMICIKTPFSFDGPLLYFDFLQPDNSVIFWYTLGCRYTDVDNSPPFTLPPPSITASITSDNMKSATTTTLLDANPNAPPPTSTSSCLSDTACNGKTHSQNKIFNISATSVECINDAITSVFVTGCQGSTGYINTLPTFQKDMQGAVTGALILYVIIFGMRMIIGQEMPNKGELFMFIMKLILVMYFSIGLPAGSNAARNGDLTQSTNGVQDIIIPGFTALSQTLSGFVFNSASNSGLCDFSKNSNYGVEHQYLSLWDSFDCRIAYYLGFISYDNNLHSVHIVFSVIFFVSIISFLCGQVFLSILLILFAAFLISMVVFLVNFFVISLVGLMITSYFAPLFVPMALFKPTKGYFDGWLKLLFVFALQPVIITAFMAMLMGALDQSLFTGCTWKQDGIYWSLSNPNDATCSKSIGAMMFFNTGATKDITINLVFIQFPGAMLDPMLLIPLLTFVLCLFLFYNFAQRIGGFAAELVGAPNLQHLTAVGATALFDTMMSAAVKGDFKTQGKTGEGQVKRDSGKGGGEPPAPSGGSGGGGGSGVSVATAAEAAK